MIKKTRIAWPTVLVQAATIISSILLAFAVDAWWASRLARDKERTHLEALQRDFEVARGRLDDSLSTAHTGHDQSLGLFLALDQNRLAELGRDVFVKVRDATGYEVYSAPNGAWATMVSSGEVGLLRSVPLQLALADLYGGLEDLRVSERQLLELVLRFQCSELYAAKIGAPDVGYSLLNPDAELGPAILARIESWRGDRVLGNWLAMLAMNHGSVGDDYEFLSDRVDRVLELLEIELRRF